MTETPPTIGMPRRSFLKWSGAAGGGAALVGAGASFGIPGVGAANAAAASPITGADSVAWNSCWVNCQSRCPLRFHVKDGTIVRVETDDAGDDELGSQQIRACVRGRSMRQRIYNADRLKAPMKRVGPRGAGEFEEITWDEAFDTIAAELERIIAEHGNEAVYLNSGTGTNGGAIGSRSSVRRFLNCLGGYLLSYGTYSTGAIQIAAPYTYGTSPSTNTFDDAVNSQLVVLWGNNPLETRMGGEAFVIQKAKQMSSTKFIVVDPRYSDTASTVGDEWVALHPGTDAALVAGMAHVMITEDLVDQEFLDTYCVGYDEEHMPEGIPAGNSYKSYILGTGPDGVVKTPAWASQITGVTSAQIISVARQIAGAKPCAISQGWGAQRQMNGENSARAVFMLALLTGNVGIPGGGTGDRETTYNFKVAGFPELKNPVGTSISICMWTDAVERGPEMTKLRDGVRGKDKLDTGIKFLFNYAGNTIVNQHMDANRTSKLLQDESLLEFILVIDNQMTASAKFADILLPDVSNVEQRDLTAGGSTGDLGYVIYADKAIEPLFDSKPIYEILTELAKRLGVEEEFTEGKTQDEWIDELIEATRKDTPAIPPNEEFRAAGVYRQNNPAGHVIPLKAFRDDPVANPLKTPSGKIEIFSKQIWDIAHTWELPEGQRITALPEHIVGAEGVEEARTNEKYPLQCIGHHYKSRTHSTYGNVPWLQEAHPQMVWINPADARERGIENDDVVQVFNDRGRIELVARVTPRIMPGVLSVPQGAWYRPDKDGLDRGGSINTLTSWNTTPLAKATTAHTNLVQVEKA
ncbi:DMSO/selenate family reductase complex A subunit [Cellulomonas timonensis]|uniref:DMSO/selenate family reductase complex A subunit n=1 Tax=Cellulomonas timonensis TaxID=1689271 RepID=UPI00082A843F|nr:DMSO/selenate family reductase complex A subunit [Cellulomonas timonensis]